MKGKRGNRETGMILQTNMVHFRQCHAATCLATKVPAKPERDAGRLVQWRLNSDRVILGNMNGDVQKKGI